MATPTDTTRRTLADGTVQQQCANLWCYNGRWFDVAPTGRPPRFCSTNCRVNQHRAEKRAAERAAAELAERERLAAVNDRYNAELFELLRRELPTNSRCTDSTVWALVDRLRASKFVEGPFPQGRLW